MDFLIAERFTKALAHLSAQDQKAAKTSAFDPQMDPSGPGLQMHRIDKSKDTNVWSARASRDLRLIVHKTARSVQLAFVGHHDEAYAWAERRRIEPHPRTGVAQIVEVRERVEEAAPLPGSPLFPSVAEAPTQVIDAWRVGHPEAYAGVPRLGRKNRLGSKQRLLLWPVFEAADAALAAQGALTKPSPRGLTRDAPG